MTYWDRLSRKTICTTVIESLQDQTRCRETGAANLEEWSGTVPGPSEETTYFGFTISSKTINILTNIDIQLLKAIVMVGDVVECQGIHVLVFINSFEMFEVWALFPTLEKVCAVQVVAKYQNIFPKPAFLNCLCTKSFATEMAATHFYCWLPLIHKITQHQNNVWRGL